jgi:predicted MFS family arabinose efflux permease
LLFSSLLAVGLHVQFFSGLLGLVIGQFVTWRFGFSTLLFLGIPLLVGVWLERRPHNDSPLRTSVLAVGVPTGLLVLVLLYSRFFERLQPPYNFAKSLLFSLDPVLGHFPINP